MTPPKNAMVVHTLKSVDGDVPVWQRESDGYINATQLCQAAGKHFGHWMENEWTGKYLNALSLDIGKPISKLIIVFKGKPVDEQGTWVHPRIALRLAQWCSPEFAVQVDKWLEAWIKGDLATDSDTMIRAFLYPHAQKWIGTFSNDFYSQLSRLYGIPYYPEKGAPESPYAALLTHKLIYSRLPGEIQAALKHYNPVMEGSRKRKRKNFQFFRKDYKMALDNMIDLCTRIMEKFTDKGKFETVWDMMCPRQDEKQLPLIPMDYYMEIE